MSSFPFTVHKDMPDDMLLISLFYLAFRIQCATIMKRPSLFLFFYLFPSFVGLPPLGYATTLNQRKADRSSGFAGVIRFKKNYKNRGHL